MKNYRSLVPFVLIFMMIMSIYTMISDTNKKQQELDALIADAESYTDQGLYDLAVESYVDAIKIDNNPVYYIRLTNMFYDINDYEQSESWCNAAISNFPKNIELYELKIGHYLEREEFGAAFSTIDVFKGKGLSSKKVDEYLNEIKNLYFESACGFEDIKAKATAGYIGVYIEGNWGLASEAGGTQGEAEYQEIGYYNNNYVPVKAQNGLWYFMDRKGTLRYNISRFIRGKIESVGMYNNGVFNACVDGKYAFYNLKFEKVSPDYDYAGSFNEGVVAVKNGDRWQILNNTLTSVTGQDYKDIIVDGSGVCCINNRIFVQNSNGKYSMLDKTGVNVGSNEYESAKLFNANDTYAAVKIDDSWGFIDIDGNVVIKPKYDDAGSFAIGFAAVCENNKWGYIDLEGNTLVELKYDMCYDFGSSGNAFVKSGSNWSIISLYRYNH